MPALPKECPRLLAAFALAPAALPFFAGLPAAESPSAVSSCTAPASFSAATACSDSFCRAGTYADVRPPTVICAMACPPTLDTFLLPLPHRWWNSQASGSRSASASASTAAWRAVQPPRQQQAANRVTNPVHGPTAHLADRRNLSVQLLDLILRQRVGRLLGMDPALIQHLCAK